LEIIGDTSRTGTVVKFFPDKKIFDTIEFVGSTEMARMKQAAYLTP
jgi:DNA gyrase subunit B